MKINVLYGSPILDKVLELKMYKRINVDKSFFNLYNEKTSVVQLNIFIPYILNSYYTKKREKKNKLIWK